MDAMDAMGAVEAKTGWTGGGTVVGTIRTPRLDHQHNRAQLLLSFPVHASRFDELHHRGGYFFLLERLE